MSSKHVSQTTLHARILDALSKPWPNECMEWFAATNRQGYGILTLRIREGVDGRMAAHRFALEYKLGRNMLPGTLACHTCDKPSCFNPLHLYEGTSSQNACDTRDRGRARDVKGTNHPMAKLTDQSVREIRRLSYCGINQREIGRRYGVSQQTISRIATRDQWGHVSDS